MADTIDTRELNRRRANEIRLALTETSRALRALDPVEARDCAAAIIRDPGPLVGSMRAAALIRALPGVGRDSLVVVRVLRHVGISHNDRLRDLTDRQQTVFIEAILRPRREQMRLQPQTELIGLELATMRRRHDRATAVLRSARGADVRLAERVLRELTA